MTVRERALAACVGLVAFTAFGVRFESEFWSAWWFYVGLGMTVSAVFLEPFFSRPQDAILNASGALGATWAAARDAAPLLWTVFGVGAGIVFLAGTIAAVLSERHGRWKSLAYRSATSMGQAVFLGGSALVIAGVGNLDDGGQYLVLGALALVASLQVPWPELFALVAARTPEAFATAVTAFGPRMLLVDAAGTELDVGDRLDVSASTRTASGTIISRMPHKSGLRYQVALDVEWHKLCRDFPTSLRLKATEGGGRIVGTIGEGTTDTVIRFEPVSPVRVGDPVAMQGNGRRILIR